MTIQEENDVIDPRVLRGAALFDRLAVHDVVPTDWRDRLDVVELDVSRCTTCVVGQTLGVAGHDLTLHADGEAGLGWHAALDRLGAPSGLGPVSSPARNAWTHAHGFDGVDKLDRIELTVAWRRYLLETRTSGEVTP